MTNRRVIKLEIRLTKHNRCQFQLSEGSEHRDFGELDYPESLITAYIEWSHALEQYYSANRRGKLLEEFDIDLQEHWSSRLARSEEALTRSFQKWLRGEGLHGIRSKLINAAKAISESQNSVDLFITCYDDELTRLPWEAWEICAEAKPGLIRIARAPKEISYQDIRPRRRKTRILVIVGCDKTLNFEKDLDEVNRTLKARGVAEVVPFYCQKTSKNTLTAALSEAIEDERGWDMLLFAGHSNESRNAGGELGIAPGVNLMIKDIEPALKKAKEHGLQFAFFNSCKGLDIAQALIGLGIGQVIVMREPIDNDAALVFLDRFLQILAEFSDVHTALLSAYQHLLKQKATYPSAYLLPSLFSHPESIPFRPTPCGIGYRIYQWRPNGKEAIALSSILLLSFLFPVRDLLFDMRMVAQSVYRHEITTKLTRESEPLSPQDRPVQIIAIDQNSINQAREESPKFKDNPIERRYLAKLVKQLTNLNAKVVGIDYFLHTQEPYQEQLNRELEKAVEIRNTWFAFAVNEEGNVVQKTADPKWRLQGNVNFWQWQVEQPTDSTCANPVGCPLAYLLALVQISNKSVFREQISQPAISNSGVFQAQLGAFLKTNIQKEPFSSLQWQPNLPWVSSYVFDFSIPPDRVYNSISASEFLKLPKDSPEYRQRLSQQITLIAAGDYSNAEDTYTPPLAIEYWCYIRTKEACSQNFTGGEALAYQIHHWLKAHQVRQIPDVWLILVAAIFGKLATLVLMQQQFKQRRRLNMIYAGVTLALALLWLQIYVQFAFLLPYFLPLTTFWTYVLLSRRNYHAESKYIAGKS